MEVTPKIRPSLVCLGDCFLGRVTDLPVSLACGQLSGPPPGPIWMPCLLHMRSSWIPGGCWCPGAGARRRGSDLCEPQMGVGRNRSPRTRGVDVAEAGGRAAATGGPAPQISQQASDSAASHWPGGSYRSQARRHGCGQLHRPELSVTCLLTALGERTHVAPPGGLCPPCCSTRVPPPTCGGAGSVPYVRRQALPRIPQASRAGPACRPQGIHTYLLSLWLLPLMAKGP